MNYDEQRVKMTDGIIEVFGKLAEGNPGATHALLELYKKGGDIDPDMCMGGLGPMLLLDTFHIYGPDIWKLYKDVCGQNVVKMVGLLRAVQLGVIDARILICLINGEIGAAEKDGEVSVNGTIAHAMRGVRERLPSFTAEETA